ncbi:MAG TPA: hypothetical protein VFX16_07800 [Pseudonocardiaceae bacterium]|nr:hypothetical protein [Pseudonocardiaceae bacterium]
MGTRAAFTRPTVDPSEVLTMAVSFDPDLPVTVYPLTYLDDADEVTVGRTDTNTFVVLPADGATLLRKLADGMPPRQGKQWYAEQYGEDIDIDEFLATLDELHLLAPRGEAPMVANGGPVRWQGLGRAMFSPLAWVCYGLLVVAAVIAMVRQPDVVPRYQNLFFTRYLVVLELGIFLGQFPLILVHEAFHALAGRRLGLSSSLHIGRRLYFVVFETVLDGLVVVPRRRRYLPILAGMIADALVIAVLSLAAVPLHEAGGTRSAIGGYLLALAFGTVLRLVWQCYIFLRTDIYYLVVTVLGCVDLHTVARATAVNRVNRLLGRTDRLVDESTWHPRDRAAARWYSWLILCGYMVMIAAAGVAVIPAMVRMVGIVVSHLDGSASTTGVVDALVFLVLNLAQFVIAGALAVRTRHTTRAAIAA